VEFWFVLLLLFLILSYSQCATAAQTNHIHQLIQTRNQYASVLWGNAIPAGPLNDFDQIFCRWWISIKKSVLLSKILTLWYRTLGLISWKSWKFQIFGKNLCIRDKSPWAIFTKLGVGRVSQVHNLTPNFTVVVLKMWAYWDQNRKNC